MKERIEMLRQQNDIASLREVAPEQIVCLKAEVAHVQSVKTTKHSKWFFAHKTRRDLSSSHRILWEDYVES
jgi:hypothetical protein